MAIAWVQNQITASETTGTGTYTTGTFTGSALTVGNTLIAVIASDGNVNPEVSAVSDLKGNVWTKDTAAQNVGEVSIWRAPITVGGTGDTITVTFNSANSNNSAICVQEFSSGGALVKDQVKSGTGTSATPTTGASPSTTVANELVVAGFEHDLTVTTFAAGTGYSNALSIFVSAANCGMESAVISATGAQTAGATWSTSRTYVCALVTYYETVAAVANTGFLQFMGPQPQQ